MIPTIVLRTEQEYWDMKNTYVTVTDIAAMMVCHRATAYRLLRRLPDHKKVQVIDHHHRKRYLVITWQTFKTEDCFRGVAPRGNPSFRLPEYQRALRARRY